MHEYILIYTRIYVNIDIYKHGLIYTTKFAFPFHLFHRLYISIKYMYRILYIIYTIERISGLKSDVRVTKT